MKEMNVSELENINGGSLWNYIEHFGSLGVGILSGIEHGGSVDFLPWSVMSPAERQEAFEPGGPTYC